MSHICILFLCHRPAVDQLIFYRQFSLSGYDVVVVVDDSSWAVQEVPGIKIFTITDEACAASGFLGSNPAISKPLLVSAWDKALYFIHYFECKYDFFWLFEEDVFIPCVQSVVRIDMANASSDLISSSNNVLASFISASALHASWCWYRTIPRALLPLPWASGMVCAVRLSSTLATAAADFVKTHAESLRCRNLRRKKIASILSALRAPRSWVLQIAQPQYLFIEFLFHTLALQWQMDVSTPDQLSHIVWRQDWAAESMLPGLLYHPVKNIADHPRLRELIAGKESNSQ